MPFYETIYDHTLIVLDTNLSSNQCTEQLNLCAEDWVVEAPVEFGYYITFVRLLLDLVKLIRTELSEFK